MPRVEVDQAQSAIAGPPAPRRWKGGRGIERPAPGSRRLGEEPATARRPRRRARRALGLVQPRPARPARSEGEHRGTCAPRVELPRSASRTKARRHLAVHPQQRRPRSHGPTGSPSSTRRPAGVPCAPSSVSASPSRSPSAPVAKRPRRSPRRATPSPGRGGRRLRQPARSPLQPRVRRLRSGRTPATRSRSSRRTRRAPATCAATASASCRSRAVNRRGGSASIPAREPGGAVAQPRQSPGRRRANRRRRAAERARAGSRCATPRPGRSPLGRGGRLVGLDAEPRGPRARAAARSRSRSRALSTARRRGGDQPGEPVSS